MDRNQKRRVWTAVLALTCGMSMCGVSAAEETPEVGELEGITVEAKRPDWESKLSPGTVTIIRPEKYKGEQKDLPDLLKEVPGVHVREVNGKGQYTVVTVRGSTAAQVGIFVDGVMTNLGGDAAVDISTIPVKNIERIEVYRGYIPARFGGTFIGGVINVVTKKPTSTHISAELGQASFGGKSASLEMVGPLKSGSLMVGLNYEAAEGDFPYHNYAMDNQTVLENIDRDYASTEKTVESLRKQVDVNSWNKSNIDRLLQRDTISQSTYDTFVDSSGNIDSSSWLDFVRSGDLIDAECAYITEKARAGVSTAWNNVYVENNEALLEDAKDWYIDNQDDYAGFKKTYTTYEKNLQTIETNRASGKWDNAKCEAQTEKANNALKRGLLSQLKTSWGDGTNPGDYFAADTKVDAEKTIKDQIYADADAQAAEQIANTQALAKTTISNLDPDQSVDYTKKKLDLTSNEILLERYKKLKEEQEKGERHRKYNDRRNINGIIKWQNQNWMVKAAYNHISRHLPDCLWGAETVAQNGWEASKGIDLYDVLWSGSKKQTIDTYDFMVQNRQQNGRLDWGWFLDYQHQRKEYTAENKLYYPWDENGNYIPWSNNAAVNYWRYSVLRGWSQYTSNKVNFQMDGSYKLSDRQILEFQGNYSYEKLGIDGSNMDSILKDYTEESFGMWTNWQIRNSFEQKILNLQVQDTFTLDKDASWFLTASWKLNQSTIIGHSDSPNFYKKPDGSSQAFRWFHPTDSQTDRKGTWQLALKKILNDHVTLRMTGGTYYRLLNMYEIAGDGAGIMPMPSDTWETACFPRPEYGTQFEFSTLWNGKLFKSDAYANFTYFWRNTDRMLQLRRKAKDFWCYTNDSRGRVNGFEFQAGMKWKHFSLDLEATYMDITAQQKVSSSIPGGNDKWFDVNATFQPEWEGNLRLSYFPNPKFTLFGEAHYTGEYYTYLIDSSSDGVDRGFPRPSITTVNAGFKIKPNKNWQFTFGCNDIFNQNPKAKIYIGQDRWINPDYPLQGRTYYASIRYEF